MQYCPIPVKTALDFQGFLSEVVATCRDNSVSTTFSYSPEEPRRDLKSDAAFAVYKSPFIDNAPTSALVDVERAPGEDDVPDIEGNLPTGLKRSCEFGSSFKTGMSMDLRMLRCS
jgi:hypothetical protein